MKLPSFLSKGTPVRKPVQYREDYRGRGVSHPNSSYARQPSQYARDNSPRPDPKLTLDEYEAGARSLEETGERQLAFAMQVNDYCKEIARDMRVKGEAVASEIRRTVAMSQKVAEGARAMTQFLYEEGIPKDPKEPAEAPAAAAGGDLPEEAPAEPASAEGEKKEVPEPPVARREDMPRSSPTRANPG